MPQKQTIVQEAVNYFFLKSKDISEENNMSSITLFGRLSRETTYSDEINIYNKVDTFWVDIDELDLEQAAQKIKDLPNQICRYLISKEVFQELYKISLNNPKELYTITPLFIKKL